MRWRILALLAFARLGLGFQFQTLASTSEYLIGDFAFDYTQIGALIGFFMLPGLFLSLPAGFAGKYASDRVMSAGGLALLSAGGLIASLGDGYWAIAVARMVSGAGFVLSAIYMTKMVADWFTGREIATALSILVMTWPLGIAAAQILHEWTAANIHWSAAFQSASVYCALAAVAVLLLYSPAASPTGGAAPVVRFSGAEFTLTVSASLVWSLFNAGYVVYLSFAPKVLTATGVPALEAAAIISLASWVMMGSGAIAGHVADRTGKPDLVLYACVITGGMALLVLALPGAAVVSSLVFGLIGAAPAGIIMALTGVAMRPQNRAFGMGVFFSSYFLFVAPAPVIAGRLFDVTGNAYYAIVFAACLFFAVAVCNLAFRLLHRRLGPLGG